jgi:hypothetical protein
MPREHGDDGTYVETVPLGRVLEVFDAVDGPVILSADVADELGCSRETARRKLQQLHDRGDLARRKVSRRVIYWRAEESDTFGGEELRGDPETTLADKSGEDGARADAVENATDTPPDPPADAHGAEQAAEGDALAAALDGLNTTDDRRGAVRACVEYLRSNGTAQKSGFVDDVYPDYPAGYGSAGGWWNKIGKEYLKAVGEEYAPVEPPEKEGSHTWRWNE